MTLPISLAHSWLQFPHLQTGDKNPASKGWRCLQRKHPLPHCPLTASLPSHASREATLSPSWASLAADVGRKLFSAGTRPPEEKGDHMGAPRTASQGLMQNRAAASPYSLPWGQPITLGVRISTYKFERNTNIESITPSPLQKQLMSFPGS